MRSSPLQELNLTGCRFRVQKQVSHTTPVGSSCLSIISQLAVGQNSDQISKWNSKFLDPNRAHQIPSADHSPSPDLPNSHVK